MARYGRAEEGALQAAAVEHMVPMEGWTALDARWLPGLEIPKWPRVLGVGASLGMLSAARLELRQRLLRIQKKSSHIMEELQEAKAESQMMDLATRRCEGSAAGCL